MATKNSIDSNIPIEISKGGSNASSFAVVDGTVIYDGTRLVTTATGVAGTVLTSNGAGVAPTYQAAGGGGGGVTVTTFTSNGTFTKQAGTKWITVIGWNSGGGGGSGARGASGSAGGGGGAGTSGTLFYEGPASFFDASETVVIGAGGTGGIAQTLNNTSGNDGGASNQSYVGNLRKRKFNLTYGKGFAGSNVGNSSSPQIESVVSYQGYNLMGSWGTPIPNGNGTLTNGSTPQSVGFQNSAQYLTGTLGGGGAGADSVVERTGGTGQSYTLADDTGATILLAGGTGGTESGVINGGNGNAPLTTGGLMTGGTGGGGGGGQHTGGVAGIGGTGALGAGGGGGGGSLNGTNSGAGGAGGAGKIIVIEIA